MPTAHRTSAAHQLAVLGKPIAHSKSPLLHAAAYRVLGLDWEYSRHEVDAAGLPGFLGSLDESWRGLSLTMPLKKAALDLSDEADPLARLTGTANTILLPSAENPARRAFNTDVPGLQGALAAAGLPAPRTVQILGSGATAACALCACAQAGARRVLVAARTPEHAQWLAPLAAQLDVELTIRPIRLADRTLAVPDLVVSTVPGGQAPDVLFTASTRRDALLFDVSYDPWPSPLAEAWREAGGRVLSGLALLVHQALIQVRLFLGGHAEAPLEGEDDVLAAMRESVGLDKHGYLRPAA